MVVTWCIWYSIDVHSYMVRNRAPGCYEGVEIARVMGDKVELTTITIPLTITNPITANTKN